MIFSSNITISHVQQIIVSLDTIVFDPYLILKIDLQNFKTLHSLRKYKNILLKKKKRRDVLSLQIYNINTWDISASASSVPLAA